MSINQCPMIVGFDDPFGIEFEGTLTGNREGDLKWVMGMWGIE